MVKLPNFNRRINFLAPSTTQDSYGQSILTFNTVYSCWASISHQSGQLLYATAEFIEKSTYRITIRYTRAIVFTPGMRISKTDTDTGITQTYEIETVLNPDDAKVVLTFLCYELDGQI